MKGANKVSKLENACAPALSPCIVYKKFAICPSAVLKCLAGFDATFPSTPVKPSDKRSFRSQPTQYTEIILRSWI